jgi:hypothetical protein
LAISAAAARLSSSDRPAPTLFDGLGEFHALDVFDDVAAGAGEYRVQHRFVGGKRRQHQAAQVRQPGK